MLGRDHLQGPSQNDECGSIFPIGAIFASRSGLSAQKEELGHTPTGCLADAARTTRVLGVARVLLR